MANTATIIPTRRGPARRAAKAAPRWKRLGFEASYLKPLPDCFTPTFARRRRYNDALSPFIDRQHDLHTLAALATLAHVEWPVPVAPGGDWRPIARKIARLAVNCFFAKWRTNLRLNWNPLTPAQARRQWPWSDVFIQGLAWALAAGDKPSARKLAEWPDTDLHRDEWSTRLAAKADQRFLVLLSDAVRGQPLGRHRDARAEVRRSGTSIGRTLLDALEAVVDADAHGATASLTEHLRWYRKSYHQPTSIYTAVACEATCIWHLARARQLELPDLDTRYMDLIVRWDRQDC